MISLTLGINAVSPVIALSANPQLSGDMPLISLTKGYSVKVSPEDYQECLRWRWSAVVSFTALGTPQVYAVREELGTRIYLQKFIAERIFGHRIHNTDKKLAFKNGDKLDCRRSNLILADKRTRRTKAKLEKIKKE